MLKTLSQAFGPSGYEDEVRGIMRSHMSKFCDSVYEDNMGNLVCHKKGKGNTILLCAHMDEVGFIISHITEEGYLKFQTVGGIDPNVLVSKRLVIGDNRIKGVIGAKPSHFKDADNSVKISDLYIDIGAKSREDARKYVDKGDYACFDSNYVEFGDGLIKGKALDDRIGCYALMKLAEMNIDADVCFAFTVQEEVGCRGARVVACDINPEIAVVIEGTTCSDVPGTDEFSYSTKMGRGPALSMRDGGSYSDCDLTESLRKIAEDNNIKYQFKTTTAGGNDASAIQVAGAGVKVCAISVPCRYIHSQSNVASKSDIENLILLIEKFLESRCGL